MADGGFAGHPALVLAGAVPIALLVDRLWGELPVRWHPVVWMGRYLNAVGSWLVPGEGRDAGAASVASSARPALSPQVPLFLAGALAWLVGAACAGAAATVLQRGLLHVHPAFAVVALGFALKPLLSWRMLHDEVAAVEAALAQSLEAGRERLARLVSRDVRSLDVVAVRESAIESLAENLNDSVVAPLFWFVLLGLPGAALYRFANTADAMWGYRGRWEWAGKWAARADDVLSWLPARITAAMLLCVPPRTPAGCWHRLAAEARRTPSPNSGWPMGAMALRLGVRLEKAGTYVLNAGCGTAHATDTAKALNSARNVVFAHAVLAPVAIVIIAIMWVIAL